MAIKHAKVSGVAATPSATDVDGADWDAALVVDTSGIDIPTTSTPPSAPASGNVRLFASSQAGPLPASIGPSGSVVTMQPFFGGRKIAIWSPVGNTTSGTGAFLGASAFQTLGTVTARNVATTDFFSAMQRVGYVTATTANSRAIAYGSSVQYHRGASANMGGFRAVFRFGSSDAATVANANCFYGFGPGSSVGTGGTQPSASLNIVGVGTDTGESTLSIMHNDGSGTATKVALGANYPAHTLNVDAYELRLYCAPNASQIDWTITRLNTNDTTSGSITTDLPVSSTLLLPVLMRGNNSTTLAVGLDVMGVYIETDN